MLNINKILDNNISKGFVMRSKNYLFDIESPEILSNTQVNVSTNLGIIFLDLSVTIDNKKFENLNEFCNYLYGIN